MTGRHALPRLIALCSIALGRPTPGSPAVIGEISISGTMIKVNNPTNMQQRCLGTGAMKSLILSVSLMDFYHDPR